MKVDGIPSEYQYKNLIASNVAQLDRINRICTPLKELGFNFFYYCKSFYNGQRFYLTNRPDYMESMLENNLLTRDSRLSIQQFVNVLKKKEHEFICYGVPKDLHHAHSHSMNIWNIFSSYRACLDHVEIWGVGTPVSNESILNFYLNDKDLLYRFLLYFKQEARDLINDPLFLYSRKIPETLINDYKDSEEGYNAILTFINQTKTGKFFLFDNKNHLSLREVECMHYVSQGKSSKEIGRLLSISSRTVEQHFESIRKKIGICNKSQMLELVVNSELKNLNFSREI